MTRGAKGEKMAGKPKKSGGGAVAGRDKKTSSAGKDTAPRARGAREKKATAEDNSFWSDLTRGRQRAVETLPNILKFPVVRDRTVVLRKIIRDGDALLDFGAGDRTLEKELTRSGLTVKYKSLDVDKNYEHDFYSLNEITGAYDVITAFELIEHVSPQKVMAIFNAAKKHLKKGGHLVISTPNVCHPVVFWRDCTHITPVRYDEAYGFFLSQGFDNIEIYRGGKTKWKDRFWAFVFRPLLKLLRLDYIRHIIITGRKA